MIALKSKFIKIFIIHLNSSVISTIVGMHIYISNELVIKIHAYEPYRNFLRISLIGFHIKV